MHKYLLSLIILISCVSCNTNKHGKDETSGDDYNLNSSEERIKGFRHNQKYINPLVVYSFMSWESDMYPYWQEIDLTASDDANRFYVDWDKEIEQKEINDFTQITYRPNDENSDFLNFSYIYLGRLSNGVEVIEYCESSKGSASYNGLIGFTFSKRAVAGDSIKHIFMRQEKLTSLQQYCDFELDKENNRVFVKPYNNMPQADFSDMDKDPFYVNFPKEATEALRESLRD